MEPKVFVELDDAEAEADELVAYRFALADPDADEDDEPEELREHIFPFVNVKLPAASA
ncbi:MAG: hypothetical protein ABW189_04915 [Rickettsiales bacterium]